MAHHIPSGSSQLFHIEALSSSLKNISDYLATGQNSGSQSLSPSSICPFLSRWPVTRVQKYKVFNIPTFILWPQSKTKVFSFPPHSFCNSPTQSKMIQRNYFGSDQSDPIHFHYMDHACCRETNTALEPIEISKLQAFYNLYSLQFQTTQWYCQG